MGHITNIRIHHIRLKQPGWGQGQRPHRRQQPRLRLVRALGRPRQQHWPARQHLPVRWRRRCLRGSSRAAGRRRRQCRWLKPPLHRGAVAGEVRTASVRCQRLAACMAPAALPSESGTASRAHQPRLPQHQQLSHPRMQLHSAKFVQRQLTRGLGLRGAGHLHHQDLAAVAVGGLHKIVGALTRKRRRQT